MRLGVYSDMVFGRSGQTLSAGQSFIRFVTSLPPRVDEVVVFGRLEPGQGRLAYALPESGVRFVPLPYYRRVSSLGALTGSLPRACAVFDRELPRLDAMLVFGPHPVALVFAALARLRGTPLVLGVRHDYPEYIRGRLPGRGWGWAVPAARGIELGFRALGRRAPAVVLGERLERRYRGGAPVLDLTFSLVPAREITSPESALGRDWDGDLRLLSVGRLDPEKNPLLLLDVLARLRARDRRWRLTVAGEGPLRPAFERAAAERGLSDAVDLLGHVPNGPHLWRLYRDSHAFLHVSLTEGLPQVLIEAMAAGLPIVATDVGGVSGALGAGARGLLVPPRDARAAAGALERLAAHPPLRRSLALDGIRHARAHTLEAQLDRLAAFVREAAYRNRPSAARGASAPPAAPASASSSQK
jgi:glycosyltransferase involved in cell wall biosynthesis